MIPNVIGYPIQMTRWGASGIAFTTENGGYQGNNAPGITYILSGTRISRTTGSVQPTPADTERVQFTWKAIWKAVKAYASGGDWSYQNGCRSQSTSPV